MKVVAFVPIRLNSKRVVGKNLKILGDKPLMCYILETLSGINKIDEVFVYCSQESIKEYLPNKVSFLKRPEFLDRDETLGKEIYEEFVNTIDADIYILAHTTSPFMKKKTLEDALDKIMNEGYDSAFSCERIQTFTWFEGKPLNYNLKEIPRTQTITPIYVETSAFFMFKRDVWKINKQRIGSKPYMAQVDKIEGVDIDWPEDFDFAERILEAYKY
ncbi:acylneuraminate cytidylyltransferase family protein [Bacteroides oleiciplenus]|uniref:Acylneuraminate cytidylyltransferase family protein n=1 Tax=Bacteroides oleiciplenus TaxID=626931 RepID=A0A3E5BCE3_9BACE|nr:acylneuraminate cytidylyltransferase family protein [Bacteroides oleiciplenus]RGN35281.1 acylneuraminate cytidylyltransferase family protein [Bacteroides oleiciplenus]